MDAKQFNEKYKFFGGIKKLTSLRDKFIPQRKIAEYFRVSQERVRQWMLEIFGSAYDPRPDRRNAEIKKMVSFYFNHSKEEFDYKYKRTSYYKQALKLIKKSV